MVQRISTLYLITYTFTLFIIVAITTRKLDRRHFTRHNANISYLAYPKCVCLFIKKLWCVSIVAEEFLMNRPLCSSSCLVPRLIITHFSNVKISERFLRKLNEHCCIIHPCRRSFFTIETMRNFRTAP